jgi:uncharacterized protein DUF4190
MMNPTCPTCGQMNPPGVMNCVQCGAPLTASPPQNAQNWGGPQGQSGPGAWPSPQQDQAPSWPPPGQAGPNYGVPPSYGQQQFGAGPSMFSPAIGDAKKTARNSLIAGLVGLICAGFILGILAIKWGREARSSLQAAGVSDGQGMALAGIILGVIDIIGWVLVIIGRVAGS